MFLKILRLRLGMSGFSPSFVVLGGIQFPFSRLVRFAPYVVIFFFSMGLLVERRHDFPGEKV